MERAGGGGGEDFRAIGYHRAPQMKNFHGFISHVSLEKPTQKRGPPSTPSHLSNKLGFERPVLSQTGTLSSLAVTCNIFGEKGKLVTQCVLPTNSQSSSSCGRAEKRSQRQTLEALRCARGRNRRRRHVRGGKSRIFKKHLARKFPHY